MISTCFDEPRPQESSSIDNIGANPRYAKELFRALAPLGKWWTSQCTANAARDEEFVELAARSGCKALFLGVESVSQESLQAANKAHNRVADYRPLIANLHRNRIAVASRPRDAQGAYTSAYRASCGALWWRREVRTGLLCFIKHAAVPRYSSRILYVDFISVNKSGDVPLAFTRVLDAPQGG